MEETGSSGCGGFLHRTDSVSMKGVYIRVLGEDRS